MFTLAHADQLIAQAGEILFGYTRSGPIGLTNVADGDLMHVTVTEVAPLPPAVPADPNGHDRMTQPARPPSASEMTLSQIMDQHHPT